MTSFSPTSGFRTRKRAWETGGSLFGIARYSGLVGPATNLLRVIRWDNPSSANASKEAARYSRGRPTGFPSIECFGRGGLLDLSPYWIPHSWCRRGCQRKTGALSPPPTDCQIATGWPPFSVEDRGEPLGLPQRRKGPSGRHRIKIYKGRRLLQLSR